MTADDAAQRFVDIMQERERWGAGEGDVYHDATAMVELVALYQKMMKEGRTR